MSLTDILYGLIAAFIAYEGVAHFVFHNIGMQTASNVILTLEKKYGWFIRVPVILIVIALGVHLQGVF